jgi:cephalosporin-C deacetylase
VVYSKNIHILLFISCLFYANNLMSQLSVSPNKLLAHYEVGDTAYFKVKKAQSGTIAYQIKYALSSFLPPLSIGAAQVSGDSAVIQFIASEPLMVSCVVTQNGLEASTVVAFSPEKLKASESEPIDFQAFWASRKAELAAISMSPQITFMRQTAYTKTYSFNIGIVDGRRAYGYISIPIGTGTFPAIIQIPPYGSVPNIVSDDATIAERAGAISVFLNIHNNTPTSSGPDEYLAQGLLTPQNYYLKYGILGIIRTIDYLQTRADFNGQVGIIGKSQGGGLALLAAGIDNRISLLVAAYPAFCNQSGLKYGKPSGFPNFYRMAQGINLPPDSVLLTVKYYDPSYAAKYFKGASMTMIAYNDNICLPATAFSAYNALKGERVLEHLLPNGHDDGPNSYANPSLNVSIFSFFRRHFKACNTPPWPWTPTDQTYHAVAGKDTVLAGYSLNLSGMAAWNNATMPSIPVYWEKVEGIGNVTFSNSSSRNTTATFSQAGVYRLRFVARDTTDFAVRKEYFTISDDIIVTINQAIPIELVQFSGNIVESQNELTWQTASEKQSAGFELQRSSEGTKWVKLAFIPSKGNQGALTDYQFTDFAPLSISYYRLKQIDQNGDSRFSNIVNLFRDKAGSYLIFPNPTTDVLTIRFKNELATDFEVSIYDALGKKMNTYSTHSNNELMFNTSSFTKGTYFVVLKNGTQLVRQMFIKN